MAGGAGTETVLRMNSKSSVGFTSTSGGQYQFVLREVSKTVKCDTSVQGESFTEDIVNKFGRSIQISSELVSTERPVSIGVLSFGLAADPTGTFFRFTKILQIVNKLYFININYGKRLEAFLFKISISYYHDPTPNRPQMVYNALNQRGKLSKRKVTLDFISAN